MDVWYESPGSRTPDALAGDVALLSTDERMRAQAFHAEEVRREYVVAHALMRRMLAWSTGVSPAELRFQVQQFGKPELQWPETTPRVRFNLTHTRSVVACAVTREFDIGLDAESLLRPAPLDIVGKYFSASEVDALRALPADAQPERFFTHWTLKEAYIKARGLGLQVPLGQFGFELDPLRISIGKELGDDGAEWQFRVWRMEQTNVAAVAVRCGQAPITVVSRRQPG